MSLPDPELRVVLDSLVCPETQLDLTACSLQEAEERIAGGAPLVPRAATPVEPFGRTPTVLLRADNRCAYPVADGFPVLLVPEMLTSPREPRRFDLRDCRYAEAYEEMGFYNAHAAELREDVETSEAARWAVRARDASEQSSSFPEPRDVWLHMRFEQTAQREAYAHIAPVTGKRILQMGGNGLDAVKFICAGADEAWLLSPMLEELRTAMTLARLVEADGALHCVLGVAEELPFRDRTFDAVFTNGSLHHTVTDLALPEVARVTRPGGRFAAIEPWRAPLHGIGTRIFGKREPVNCTPMDRDRSASLFTAFHEAAILQHGGLTRYPLLALWKLGIRPPATAVWHLTRADDCLAAAAPRLRRFGSCAAFLAEVDDRTGNGDSPIADG